MRKGGVEQARCTILYVRKTATLMKESKQTCSKMLHAETPGPLHVSEMQDPGRGGGGGGGNSMDTLLTYTTIYTSWRRLSNFFGTSKAAIYYFNLVIRRYTPLLDSPLKANISFIT